MGAVLRSVSAVPWGKLRVASGTAQGIPSLLSKVAWGDEGNAFAALEELQFSICRDGLAVSEATEHVIPFLWEIAEVKTGMVCGEILRLLDCILMSCGWSKAYAAAPQKDKVNYAAKFDWERNSRRRVCGGLNVVRKLQNSGDGEVARAADLLERHIISEMAKGAGLK